MRRREFIAGLAGAAAWPLAGRAQQPERMRRIGVLSALAADDPESMGRIAALLQGLQELGWSVGRNVRIDYRWGASDADRARRSAAELVALVPDIILANGGSIMAPLQQVTRTVPIVFAAVADPVGSGFVASLARPGGNATGFANFEYGISGKWLELLKQLTPAVKRVAVLRDPTVASGSGQLGAIQAVAPGLGVELSPVNLRDVDEIERDVAEFAGKPNGGMIVTAGGAGVRHRDVVVPLAARHRLPAIYANRFFVDWRRADLLWGRHCRPLSARGQLRRSHPQGREARRPAGPGADQVRTRDQSQNRQGARPRRCRPRCSPAPTR